MKRAFASILVGLLVACGGDGGSQGETDDTAGPSSSPSGPSTGAGSTDGGGSDGGESDTGSGGPDESCVVLAADWEASFVAEGPSRNQLRLAVAPDGRPALAWVRAHPRLPSWHQLVYAARVGDVFQLDPRAENNIGIKGVGLGIAPDGTPYLSYGLYDSVDVTVVIWHADGEWQQKDLTSQWATDYSSVAVTPDGVPWVIYKQLTPLMASRFQNDTWSTDIIDDGVVDGGTRSAGLHNSIVIDGEGIGHISYVTYSYNELFYATGQPENWTRHLVAEGVREERTSIAVAPDGTVHIAHGTEEGIAVASGSPDGWTSVLAAAGETLHGARLVLFPDGSRLVLYTDESTLHVARDDGGGFESEPFAVSTSPAFDLVLGPDGVLHAAWVGSDQELCHATRVP